MVKKKKMLRQINMPEFDSGIENMPEESKIFVDKSLEIADYLQQVLIRKGIRQKDLAEKMGKSEAEVSKLLSGMHNFTLRSISKLEVALGCTILCTPSQKTYKYSPFQIFEISKQFIIKNETYPTAQINYGKVVQMNTDNMVNQNEKIV